MTSFDLMCCNIQPPLKVQCPFDALHIIDTKYFEKHIANCASNGNVREKHISKPRQLGLVSLETVTNLSVPLMKDWKEENVPTYDPLKSTENRNIIRCLISGPKSQKRQFRLAERQRIRRLERNGICNSSLRNGFKRKVSKKHVNVSQLSRNLRRLTLVDIDTLLNSIDISKLIISEVEIEKTFTKKKFSSEFIEKILTTELKKLVLNCIE